MAIRDPNEFWAARRPEPRSSAQPCRRCRRPAWESYEYGPAVLCGPCFTQERARYCGQIVTDFSPFRRPLSQDRHAAAS